LEKKYYWLKLQEHFFEDDKIIFLESQENGEKYIVFWQKLLLRCLKNKDNINLEYGFLRFSEKIPYNSELLSKVTHTNIDTVRVAIKLFQELEMIEILEDGTIYIEAVNNLIGKENSSTERVRRHREKKKLLEEKQQKEEKRKKDETNNVTDVTFHNVTGNNFEVKCNDNKDIEKDIDIDIEKEKDTHETSKRFNDYEIEYNNFLKENYKITQDTIDDSIYDNENKKETINLIKLTKKFKDVDKFKLFLTTAFDNEWLRKQNCIPSILYSQYSKIIIDIERNKSSPVMAHNDFNEEDFF